VQIKLFNTMGRVLEDFVPLEANKVKMYACGPTVYNFAHIGNLRTYIFVDVLRRTLEAAGYAVDFVMNVTDVGHLASDADEGEDKIMKSAREKKLTVWEIAEFYTKAFFEDTRSLNIKKPGIVCKATEHINEMIDLVARLEQKGFTYASGGNIYFDISKFPGYGRLALLNLDELVAGSRIQVDPNKKNAYDFVLWFTKSKFEHQAMMWDSPWGKGYPGWHLECSAMSMKYLGEQFDIHAGGIDLASVHHTNEIAQSEAATGKKWVNYWVHGEFLNMGKEKMSKSKGNFFTVPALREQGYDPLDYRYFCLLGHYRSQVQFTLEALDSARNARKNLILRIDALRKEAEESGNKGLVNEDAKNQILDFFYEQHAFNDLNMPQCISDLWTLIKLDSVSPATKLAGVYKMDEILGLRLAESKIDTSIEDEAKALIEEREKARKNKDFKRSDEIREKLKQKGITIEDTPQGVRWRKI
jgi:cysteinyl-tRNA synthetase